MKRNSILSGILLALLLVALLGVACPAPVGAAGGIPIPGTVTYAYTAHYKDNWHCDTQVRIAGIWSVYAYDFTGVACRGLAADQRVQVTVNPWNSKITGLWR